MGNSIQGYEAWRDAARDQASQDAAVERAADAAKDTLRRPTEAELDELFAELDKAFNPWDTAEQESWENIIRDGRGCL